MQVHESPWSGPTGVVSVATAAYDGYDLERILESLARVGARHVDLSEPIAFSARVGERWYSKPSATAFSSTLARYGLQCHALSAHLDLLDLGQRAEFTRRLEFAHRVGAGVVNVLAGPRRRERDAVEALRWAAARASELGLRLGVGNPADGSESLFNVAADGPRLLEQIGFAGVGLTYDVGNTLSHRPAVDPVADALAALPYCVHVHVKDVHHQPTGLFHAALGQGCLKPGALVRAARHRGVSMSVDLPLRQHRLHDGMLGRSRYRVALQDIEAAVAASLRWLDACSASANQAEPCWA